MKFLRRPTKALVLAAITISLWMPSHTAAHVFTITKVQTIFTTQRTYQIDITMDVDAIALEVPSSTDSAEVAAALRALSPDELTKAIEHAKTTISHRVRVRFDGKDVTPQIAFPEYENGAAAKSSIPTVLGITTRLSGPVPDGAKEFVFWCSRTFQFVELSIHSDITGATVTHMLGQAEESPPFPLQSAPIAPSRWSVAVHYFRLGYEHILPKGTDHILFVLGLFLLSTRAKPLLLQITAFTIAHSVTLALSMYDIVKLPSSVVEPLIALSISYVAFENTITSELKPWRPAVVFCFGLLHGMGFASVLKELGLERDQFATALVAFNVGVEGGQLSVVLLTFALVGWFRKRAWYRSRVVIPISILIGLIGLYWAVTRTLAAMR